MSVVIDTHVHVYPEYDTARLLTGAVRRLQALAPGAVPAICLTERERHHAFAYWASADHVPGTEFPVQRIEGAGGVALSIETASGPLYVLRGRQVATAERLEVLALGCDSDLVDGTRAEDAIHLFADEGAITVLPWGFGKWWFDRAETVQALVSRFAPEHLWLGDSTLRPREWPAGGIMRRAIAAGTRVLAGSDPLPGAREVDRVGRYATLLEGTIDPTDPAGWILQGFRSLPPGGRTVGHRGWLPAILRRMARGLSC